VGRHDLNLDPDLLAKAGYEIPPVRSGREPGLKKNRRDNGPSRRRLRGSKVEIPEKWSAFEKIWGISSSDGRSDRAPVVTGPGKGTVGGVVHDQSGDSIGIENPLQLRLQPGPARGPENLEGLVNGSIAGFEESIEPPGQSGLDASFPGLGKGPGSGSRPMELDLAGEAYHGSEEKEKYRTGQRSPLVPAAHSPGRHG
jgi:hypothetical protein